jgi:hypothetical protein
MVRIAITQAAFDAIAKTLPFGDVGYENKLNEKGECLIWLEPSVVDRLRSLRGRARATATSSCGWLGRHNDERRQNRRQCGLV